MVFEYLVFHMIIFGDQFFSCCGNYICVYNPQTSILLFKKSTVIQGWVKTHVIAVSPPPASEKYGVFIAQSTDVIHLVSSQDFRVMKPWYESACARTRGEDAEMLIVCPISYISPVVDAGLWTQAVWSKSLKFKTLP